MKFLVVIEKGRKGFAAYSPDIEGCVAAGRTRRATEKAMRTALEMHLDALREEGLDIPPPRSTSTYLEVTRKRAKGRG